MKPNLIPYIYDDELIFLSLSSVGNKSLPLLQFLFSKFSDKTYGGRILVSYDEIEKVEPNFRDILLSIIRYSFSVRESDTSCSRYHWIYYYELDDTNRMLAFSFSVPVETCLLGIHTQYKKDYQKIIQFTRINTFRTYQYLVNLGTPLPKIMHIDYADFRSHCKITESEYFNKSAELKRCLIIPALDDFKKVGLWDIELEQEHGKITLRVCEERSK